MYDECDDEDCDCTTTRFRRFRGMDAAVMAVRLPRILLGAAAEWFQELCELIAGHANWKLQQESPIGVTA